MKLSPAQRRFLADFAREGYSLCPGGYAHAARDASAWWRTMNSLRALGLVHRPDLSSIALLTWRGLAFAVEVLSHSK